MSRIAVAPSMQRTQQQRRRYLMCRPEHFTVSYSINPWMEPERATDTGRAVRQWQELHDAYLQLGHTVELIDPVPGLPDMVYAANGGFTYGGVAYGAKFRYPQRQPEAQHYLDWLAADGFEAVPAREVNEGEGDILLAGSVLLAGCGFRSSTASHGELAELFNLEVLPLELVNPSFYHLDTALAVLDPVPRSDGLAQIAYLPAAFSEDSLAVLRERFPDAILLDDDEARVFGLNCCSDGRTVVVPEQAPKYQQQLRERGYEVIGLDLSELLLGGGGIKCCTLELRG